jgi:hypothetical protein
MHAVGKSQLVTDYVEQQFVRQASAFIIFRAAVYDFLQNDVPVRVVGKVGEREYPLKVAPMTVYVSCYQASAIRGQTNQTAPSELVRIVGFYSLLEQVDYFLRHFL